MTEIPQPPAEQPRPEGLRPNPYKELGPEALDREAAADAAEMGIVPGFDEPEEPDEISEPVARPRHDRLTRKQRLARRFAPLVLSTVSIGVGASVLVTEHTQSGDRHASAGVSRSFEPESHKASETTGHPRVNADFRKALVGDTCATKVNYHEVVGMYNQITASSDYKHFDLSALQARAKTEVTAFKSAASKLEFATPPANLPELQNDAEGGPQKLPIAEYERTATEYLKQFGINLEFHWGTGVGAKLYNDIEQVPGRDLRNDQLVRPMLTSIITSFQGVPKSLVTDAGVTRMLVGNIGGQSDVLGETDTAASNTIMLDITAMEHSPAGIENSAQVISVAPVHEMTHDLMYNTCFKRYGGYLNDVSYDSLNRGFKYGKKAVNKMYQPGHDGKYTSLASGNRGEAVVARPYGATDDAEDQATLLGEDVFVTANTTNLFTTPANTQIIDEKLALLLARLQKHDPDAAEYFVKAIHLARLDQAIYEAGNYADGKSVDRQSEHYFKLSDNLLTLLTKPSSTLK